MRGKSLMIQGTASSVGKSVLCAAFLRIMKQDGYQAAPFKAQNMALNSFVTRDGLEMGRAQATQAQAAGMEPDVRMNPVLLKPASDRRSQVIVDGKAIGTMTAMEYHKYKPALRKSIKAAYDALESTVDCVVIEGAGSPAEINLRNRGMDAAIIRQQKGLSAQNAEPVSFEQFREREFDRIADIVRASVDMDAIYRIVRGEV